MAARAANYLNQIVQLINRELPNAPQRRCYAPYLVKLKVAVVPYRSRLPYAIHTRIGFFDNDDDDKQEQSPPQLHAVCNEPEVPMVLPIIAADDMQVALKSKAVEVAQQLGLALSFMAQGVGGSAGAQNLRQSLNAVLSNDLSSSLTVTRSSQNVLYLRIAPNNEPSGAPAMVGQTYDIAVLLLVPLEYLHRHGDRQVRFDLVTEYRDARNGEILAIPSDERRTVSLDRVITPFLSAAARQQWKTLNRETKLYVGQRLSRAATAPNPDTFISYIGCIPGSGDDNDQHYLPNIYDRTNIQRGCRVTIDKYQARFVMTAMGAYVADSPLKGGIIDVPEPTPIGIPEQTVIVADNGTTAASAIISGVRGSIASRLQGYLELKAAGDNESRRIPSTGATLDPTAHTLTFTFPSTSIYKTDKETWDTGGNLLTIEQICDDQREWCPEMAGPPSFVNREKVRVVSKPGDVAGTSKMTLTATSQSILYDGAGGTIAVSVGKMAATEVATLSVSNADLILASDSVTGSLRLTGDGAIEPKNGYVTLTLGNLNGGQVTITATAKVGTKTTGSSTITRPLSVQLKSSKEK